MSHILRILSPKSRKYTSNWWKSAHFCRLCIYNFRSIFSILSRISAISGYFLSKYLDKSRYLWKNSLEICNLGPKFSIWSCFCGLHIMKNHGFFMIFGLKLEKYAQNWAYFWEIPEKLGRILWKSLDFSDFLSTIARQFCSKMAIFLPKTAINGCFFMKNSLKSLKICYRGYFFRRKNAALCVKSEGFSCPDDVLAPKGPGSTKRKRKAGQKKKRNFSRYVVSLGVFSSLGPSGLAV